MPCTTILVGKNASYDGSTFAARNEDSSAGKFNPKKLIVVHPDEQPRRYRSVLTHAEIELPEAPMRYTAMPNATDEEGVWGAAGVNAANVAMTATETITSNPRVLAADPLVQLIPAKDGLPEKAGGIGEEDFITLVLPYIHSAREGVLRLGGLLLRLEDGSLTGTEFSTQFSQVIEAEGMGKDSFPQVVLLFSGVYYELNGDGRGGSMELHLVLQAAVRSRTEVRYIADAYSNAFSLERETERLEQPCVLSELTLSTSLREQLDPGFAPGEVVLSELTPGQAQIDGDTVSVPLTALLYCLDGEGRVLAAERTVQARFRYELAAGQRLEPCEIALREAQASPGQDGVELRVQTEVRVFVTGDMQTDCIRALRYDESVSADLSDEPSLTLLRASSGDSLWEIAKRCHSTVDLIREVNGLEDLPQPWEKLIAIPIAR